ncbi:MAG: hypothetical protein JSV92_01835 [archaeon]|nr:MAG: hypothetical protein JSV92_01835 [archaeon]
MCEVKENGDNTKEIEVKCHCGRKIKVRFLSPIMVEQSTSQELRGEDSW